MTEVAMPRPKAIAKTNTGCVRAGNEDCFHSDDGLGLWLVADGMGGHEAGEVASAIVSQVVADEITEGSSLSDAIQSSHQSILGAAEQGLGARGMGSTIVAIRLIDTAHWQLGWVGDSRAYLWSLSPEGDGELQQISRDHSYVQALFDSGAITQAEMENHPEKNVITQCLGSLEISKVRVDTTVGEWKPRQKILLCSDGLSDEVNDAGIANILNEFEKSEDAVDKLIEAALKNGGRDNVTVILIDAPENLESVKSTASETVESAPATEEKKSPTSKWVIIGSITAGVVAAALLAGVLIYFFG